MKSRIFLFLILSLFALVWACSKNPDSSDMPMPPSDLAGLAVGAYSVNLRWNDNSDNENAFLIYRKIAGSYEQAGRTDPNRNFYHDKLPVSCVEVRYYIIAEGENGQSARSNIITVPLLCGIGL